MLELTGPAPISALILCKAVRASAAGLLAFCAGCASSGMVSADQTTIEPDVSLVAFSVDSGEWAEEDVWVRPKGLLLHHADETVFVELDHDAAQPQRILIEVPADEIALRQFVMDSGAGLRWRQFLSGIDRSFQLTRGEVNYIGRLEVEGIRFDIVDRVDRRQPVSIKFLVTDALADDLLAWHQDYQIFQDFAPETQALSLAAEFGYRAVWPDEYAISGLKTGVIRRPIPIRRPPRSTNDPNPGGGGGGSRPNRPNN